MRSVKRGRDLKPPINLPVGSAAAAGSDSERALIPSSFPARTLTLEATR